MDDFKNRKNLTLPEINYKQAGINIAKNIISKFQIIKNSDDLIKVIDSALYDYDKLKNNYLNEISTNDSKIT